MIIDGDPGLTISHLYCIVLCGHEIGDYAGTCHGCRAAGHL